MVALITDPVLEERLKAERRATGGDRYDEVWEDVYMMSPLANVEHQLIVTRLAGVFASVLAVEGGKVFAGVNLSDRGADWEHNYRAPDVAVLLADTRAESYEAHIRGPADFLVEVISPGDRTREKFDFYSRLGVRELLVIDRAPWSLELYRHDDAALVPAGRTTAVAGEVLESRVVPFRFQLLPADPRPWIHVVEMGSGETWKV